MSSVGVGCEMIERYAHNQYKNVKKGINEIPGSIEMEAAKRVFNNSSSSLLPAVVVA